MNGLDTFLVGIAPQHAPALAAALVLPFVVWLARRLGLLSPVAMSTSDRWVMWLLGIAAAVHLALPLGHADSPLSTLGFLGTGIAFVWLALRIRDGRPWRAWAVPLLLATLVAYLVVAGSGREEPDQVGIATALVELTALGLALVPRRRPARFARLAGGFATVLSVILAGAVVWIGSFLAHAAAAENTVGHTHEHDSGHAHAARAQAGVIMRPAAGDHDASAAQVRSATALAEATRRAMARYADLRAALTAGYRLPGFRATGPDVHLEHPRYKEDGHVLDPQRPEMLVYAIDRDRATLLGVVYVMEVAGRPGPAPGGPITQWHAHNLCISALPPGFGIVSPYGGCPAFSVNLTSTEMMHVWVVPDPPGGAFADGLDEAWVRAYHTSHARRR